MDKKIMFLYHIKEREYEIITLIEQQIKKNIPNAEIRSGEFYSSIFETIYFRPDIIVSIPPRDSHSSNYLTVLKVITGAVVISMNTEGYYHFTPGEIQCVTGYNTYAKELVDYFIVWGPKTREMLGTCLIKDGKLADMRRIKATGYALYEINKTEKSYKKNNMYQTMKKWFGEHEKNILVITGFLLADISVKSYQKFGYFGNDVPLNKRTSLEINQAEKTIAADGEFREKYINMIISLAKLYPDVGIVVKLHPIEVNNKTRCYDVLLNYPNIFVVKETVPVGIMFKYVDAMIHYNSTCNLEAYIYKVPTIQMYDDSKVLSCELVTWQFKSESTYLININDFQRLNNVMREGMVYRQLKSVEKELFDMFNWEEGRDYKAIEKNAYYISHAQKPQRLKYHDSKVIEAIRSSEGQRVADILFQNIWGKNNKVIFRSIYAIFRIYKFVLCNRLLADRQGDYLRITSD